MKGLLINDIEVEQLLLNCKFLKLFNSTLHIEQLIIIISLKPNMKILNTKNSNKINAKVGGAIKSHFTL